MVEADWVKPGAVVIDVGMNRTDDGLAGDVAFDEVAEVAGAITPVPGGVGPMTIACLLRNTLHGRAGWRSVTLRRLRVGEWLAGRRRASRCSCCSSCPGSTARTGWTSLGWLMASLLVLIDRRRRRGSLLTVDGVLTRVCPRCRGRPTTRSRR